MELSEALRIKELEEENRRLKLIVTDQTLHITVLTRFSNPGSVRKVRGYLPGGSDGAA